MAGENRPEIPVPSRRTDYGRVVNIDRIRADTKVTARVEIFCREAAVNTMSEPPTPTVE